VTPSAFRLAELRRQLKPFRLHWYPRLRSTSSHAAVLRRRGELFAPAVVLTGHQLAGRGRGGNTWWSGEGSLTVTFALAAEESVAAHHVPLLAGLAVRAAAAELAGTDDVQLKWPNDLLHRGRKLAGLLCERVDKADLVGVGLNVNCDLADVPPHLRDRVTSLNDVAGRSVDMTEALLAVARHLHRTLAHRDQGTFAAALREYDRHHALVGRRVTVIGGPGEPAVTGRCEGLDETGRLLLRERRALHRVIAGHVQLL
jgi:BirA family biotin operon repressor/biotin-[acetyl-CoA-carboxylase] ligase